MYFSYGSPYPTITEESILGFFQAYRFLSNFHLCNLTYKGVRYPSAEHAYMAQKTLVPEEQFQFTLEVGLTPSEAKKAGREVTLRPDWESVKDGIMRDILLHKFQQNPDLKKKLLDTGEKYLEETNYWKDTYWGVCEGVGYNHLGKLLMSVRGELTTATS